jgi:hypothetical protein
MKRFLFLLAAAALVLPAAASAKGPSEAKITGPGLDKPIKITGTETDGSPIMNLAEAAGFFPAAFGQEPNVMITRPPGDLGPKYLITYEVPGGNDSNFTIRQDVYPYAAKPYALTYTKPGQPIFDMHTKGGWWTDQRLKGVLVAAGLPKSPPAEQAKTSSSAGFLSTGKIGAVVLVLFGIGAAAVLTRRHLRRTATT